MTSRTDILTAVKANRPGARPGHPAIPAFEDPKADLLALFKENLEIAGGTWHHVDTAGEAGKIMAEKLPGARIIASATGEWPGNRSLGKETRPQDLEDVDLGIVRAEFGVAEMGSVWLTQASLKINALGVLSQHLAVLLDPDAITANMHTAYQKTDLLTNPYGCFMMGPSATADIGATLVHGAQGARSLTLFFLKAPVA